MSLRILAYTLPQEEIFIWTKNEWKHYAVEIESLKNSYNVAGDFVIHSDRNNNKHYLSLLRLELFPLKIRLESCCIDTKIIFSPFLRNFKTNLLDKIFHEDANYTSCACTNSKTWNEKPSWNLKRMFERRKLFVLQTKNTSKWHFCVLHSRLFNSSVLKLIAFVVFF